MYSPSITQQNLEKVEQALKLKLHRYEPAQSYEISQFLQSLRTDKGEWKRPPRKEELAFIRNERILAQQDFHYFTRYANVILDQGGIGPLKLWESQQVLLKKVAQLEERNIEQQQRSEPSDGILIADHKGGRQLGHTAVARALVWHRILTYGYTRAATVCVDEPGIHKVYEKDELLFEHVPFFLKPNLTFNEKDQHYGFSDFGSSLTYYQSQQRSGSGTGIGTGATYDISHMTEVSTYAYPDMLEMDFFPTLPQNPYTLCVLETTAFGRGNWWHIWSEAVRKGKKARWSYLFIPFYAEPSKYRRHPQVDWTPNETTLMMAKKVEESSPEFVGKAVILTREQLYWWETSYMEALESNSLNKFLSNYAITPEQSYQHSSVSAVPAQILDWMRTTTKSGVMYELETA